MQNLRDQLLKSGLASKQQKQQVEQEKRRARKQQRKGQAEESALQQQRQAYEAKLEAQRLADRQRAQVQRQETEEREKLLQIRHVIDYWRLPEERGGARRWYFVTRDRVIKYLYVTEPTALQLSTGALAIVEHPETNDFPYVLVERDAAQVITNVDTQYVRFYNRDSVQGADRSEGEDLC